MRWIGRFGPPLTLMGLIFYLSAQPNLSTGLGTLDLIGRKLVHMAEYGLLWLLWWRAFDFDRRRGIAAAAAIALAYAATDEWHQTFTDGRHGSPIDWAIDAAGVGVAFALTRRRGPGALRPRRRARRSRPWYAWAGGWRGR